ncbi:hypothetical protein D5S17_14805 [Pseudonocardiaceae bacterium YIM PH 21723]|nr:hypothetical protein D5S17_14805 [Pseudonocardiaceae bacterium YIM PH 21723]
MTHRANRYRLDLELATSDLLELEAAIADAYAKATDFRRIIELCRPGELLHSAAYSWAEPVREVIRHQALNALFHVAHTAEDTMAVEALQVAVRLDPYAEQIYQHLIRRHTDAGRPDAAIAIYRQLRARLAEIDAEPTNETEALLPIPRSRPRR